MNKLRTYLILGILILALCSPSSLARAEEHQIQFHEGWTLIGLPVTPDVPYTAESLGQEINAQDGTCDRIMHWDGGMWQTHLIGMPFGDFPIETNEGYFVLCDSESTWTVSGDPIGSLSQEFNEGWTLINSPFENLTAESMGDDINSQGGTCNRIMHWDGGMWQTHLIDMPFGDFPIQKEEGYFVLCESYSTWDYEYDVTPPLPPTLDAVTSPTNVSPQTISGTKDVDSSVWLNGAEIVGINANTNWSYDMDLVEDDNPISLTSKDDSGNESSPAVTENIILDTVLPVVVITSPADGVHVNVSPITLEGTIDGLPFSEQRALSEGENTVTKEETDLAGNTGSDEITVTLDTVAPVIIITNPISETLVFTSEIDFEGTIDGVGFSETRTITFGVNDVAMEHTDEAGNTSIESVEVFLAREPVNIPGT